jgi:phage replication-related protein YjqB (UPF0714/DUF867 family)
MGKYDNYRELSENETKGKDYRIHFTRGESGIVVMAPHGGGIEPGTTEIADALAGMEHSFYSFDGVKKRGNWNLHITSRQFDEPIGIDIAKNSPTIVTVHGCKKKENVVYIGGRDNLLKEKIIKATKLAGFAIKESSRFPGINELNICNRSRTGRGVQLEISMGLRRAMFQDISRMKRKKTTKVFNRFVNVIRNALSDF